MRAMWDSKRRKMEAPALTSGPSVSRTTSRTVHGEVQTDHDQEFTSRLPSELPALWQLPSLDPFRSTESLRFPNVRRPFNTRLQFNDRDANIVHAV